MDVSEDVLLSWLALAFTATAGLYIAKSRRKRQYKTRTINRKRHKLGFYTATFLQMKKKDPAEFFAYTRMTVPMFEQLLDLITPVIKKKKILKDSVNSEQRLAITLHYLSQGCSMRTVAWSYQLGRATVHHIIKDVCHAIWEILSPIYLKEKSETEWKMIADDFWNKWQFPNCIGALDGKHVAIEAPPNSGSLFHNYKSFFSVVLMALCDANYIFTCIDVGAYGSQSDGGIFRNSVFGQRFEEKSMNVPPDKNIPNTNITMPYVIVADEAFPLKNYIMRPYPGRLLTLEKKIFNYRLSRARRVIENSFGVLVARWRILRTTIIGDVNNIDNIIKAVVCLHNFCKLANVNGGINSQYCPPGYVDTEDENNGGWRKEVTNLPSVGRLSSNNSVQRNYIMRNQVAAFFQSDAGKVPWQLEKVTRGCEPAPRY